MAAMSMAFVGVAYADNIQDDIVDTGTGVTLVAGSVDGGTATIRVIGTGGDGDAGCNWDPGDSPLVLDVVTPTGVTATPNPLEIRECHRQDGPGTLVTFTASASAVSGIARVTIS
ncbi:MAG: hypothetical protein ACRDOZ_13150, partial [Nocardioides sp.]